MDYVCPHKPLVAETVLRVHTGDQFGFVLGLVVDGSESDRNERERQGGAVFHAIAPLQHGGVIEEENGKNDGRTSAILNRWRKGSKRSVCVFYMKQDERKRTRKTEIHVQNEEMARNNVSDGKIPKKIHLEVTKVRMERVDNIEKKSEAFREIMCVNEINDGLLAHYGALKYYH